MSTRKLGLGGSALVLWVALLGVVALPALASPEAPEALKSEPIKPTEATLQGIVNPKITLATEPGTYQFLYKATKKDTTAECESVTASKAPASPDMYLGVEPEHVSEPVMGLTEGTEYIVCLVTSTAGGTTVGPPYPFKTGLKLEIPVNAKVKAGSITATSAEVEGELNPGKERKTDQGYVEYLYKVSPLAAPPTGECEESVFEENGVHYQSTSGVKEEKVSGKLTNLQPNAKYTFCLRVGNEDGETVTGAPATFTTKSAPPKAIEGSEHVSAVNSKEATLEAEVNPNNQETTYGFEYSTEGKTGAGEVLEGAITTVKGTTPIPTEEFGPHGIAVPTTAVLAPGTTYYYRLIAENAAHEKAKAGSVQSFTTPATPGTASVTAVAATTATFHGSLALNPVDTTYSFAYKVGTGTGCTGESATPVADAGTGTGNTATEATPVTGLLANTLYTVCFVTTNTYGTQTGPPVTFRTLPDSSVTKVTGESAELHATLNPEGGTTTYHFEYVPEAQFEESGFTNAKKTGAETVEGSGPVAVEAPLYGLTTNTTYHYRVLAERAGETFESEDETFTTQTKGGPPSLIDGRQWEMVSPPNKHGAGIQPYPDEGAAIQAAANGSAITYVASAPVTGEPAGNRSPEPSQIFSRRAGPGVWATQDIETPNNGVGAGYQLNFGPEYRLFSADLEKAIVEPRSSTPLSPNCTEEPAGPEPRERTVYLRNTTTSTCTPLLAETSVPAKGHVEFAGASPTLEHVVVRSERALTNEAVKETEDLDLWEWNGDSLGWLSLKPSGLPVSDNSEEEGGTVAAAAANLGGISAVRGAVASVGSRTVWAGEDDLFLRDMASHETVRLDRTESGCARCQRAQDTEYLGANSNDSRVFFTDSQPLLSGSHEDNSERGDLYEAYVKPGVPLTVELTDLTETTIGNEPANVKGRLLGYNTEGTTLYFVAGGRLTPNATAGGANLYVDRLIGNVWIPHLVASLGTDDASDWERESAEVSPNARYLTFMSSQRLAGYDNRDAVSGASDEEVYLYDAETEKLVCASCNPTGARPHGVLDPSAYPGILVDSVQNWRNSWLAASTPGQTRLELGYDKAQPYQSRYLSNDGRLFFDSADGLVPQDGNGVEDVYEYEPEGASCDSASGSSAETFHDATALNTATGTLEAGSVPGCVGLISSGHSAQESVFLDAGESGEDVFFITAAPLLAKDTDTAYDVYDAHVCSAALPCPGEVAPPAECATADSCRAAATPQPGIFGAAPSATFSGAGNQAPSVPAVVKPKVLTRAQKLAAALKTCRKKSRRQRAGCEKLARKRYGAAKLKRTKKAGNNGRATR